MHGKNVCHGIACSGDDSIDDECLSILHIVDFLHHTWVVVLHLPASACRHLASHVQCTAQLDEVLTFCNDILLSIGHAFHTDDVVEYILETVTDCCTGSHVGLLLTQAFARLHPFAAFIFHTRVNIGIHTLVGRLGLIIVELPQFRAGLTVRNWIDISEKSFVGRDEEAIVRHHRVEVRCIFEVVDGVLPWSVQQDARVGG